MCRRARIGKYCLFCLSVRSFFFESNRLVEEAARAHGTKLCSRGKPPPGDYGGHVCGNYSRYSFMSVWRVTTLLAVISYEGYFSRT